MKELVESIDRALSKIIDILLKGFEYFIGAKERESDEAVPAPIPIRSQDPFEEEESDPMAKPQ